MGRRLYHFKQPEGGAEREVFTYMRHQCPEAEFARKALDEPDADLLEFNVGLQGQLFPAGVPFEVHSTYACLACSKDVAFMGVWDAPKIYIPGVS